MIRRLYADVITDLKDRAANMANIIAAGCRQSAVRRT
jgi:hypothetical protein